MSSLQIKNGNAKKNQIIDDFIQLIDGYKKGLVVLRDKGLKANDIVELRNSVSQKGRSNVKVIKNRLIIQAFDRMGIQPEVLPYLKGKNMFFISDNTLDAMEDIYNLPKEISKKIEVLCLSDSGGIISNSKSIKEIGKNQGFKGVFLQTIAAVQNPILSIAKILDLKAKGE